MKQRVFCGLSLTIALACSGGTSMRGGGGTGGEEETGGTSGGNTGGSKATGGAGPSTGGAGGGNTGGAMSTGGAGGSGTGGAMSTGGAGGSTGGAGGGGAGGMAGGGGGEPAAALNMFLFDVPCPTPTTAGNCQIPTEMRKKMKMVQFGGDAAKTYQVKLHFCGPVEGQKFANCKMNPIPMQDSHVCIDGTPSTSPSYMANYPAYSMKVAETTYFLNNGWVSDDLVKIDYSASFNIKGGTTIIFQSDGGANTDTYTPRLKGHNFMCPGVPMIMQPFAGQFIYVTVEGVTAM